MSCSYVHSGAICSQAGYHRVVILFYSCAAGDGSGATNGRVVSLLLEDTVLNVINLYYEPGGGQNAWEHSWASWKHGAQDCLYALKMLLEGCFSAWNSLYSLLICSDGKIFKLATVQRSAEVSRGGLAGILLVPLLCFLGSRKQFFPAFLKHLFQRPRWVISSERNSRVAEKCPFLSFLIYLCVSVEQQIGFSYFWKREIMTRAPCISCFLVASCRHARIPVTLSYLLIVSVLTWNVEDGWWGTPWWIWKEFTARITFHHSETSMPDCGGSLFLPPNVP